MLVRLRAMLKPNAAWLALISAFVLTVIGILAIATTAPTTAQAQLRWLGIAMVVAAVCLAPKPRAIGLIVAPLVLVHLLLLVFVILPGVPGSIVPRVNGATSWIDLRFMRYQPSETAKVVFVLAIAWYLRHAVMYRTMRGLILLFASTLVPVVLLFKQPDLGTALLFAPTLFIMLIAAGARLKHLGLLAWVALLLVVLNIAAVYALPESAQLLKPHQQVRIKAMIAQLRGDTKYLDSAGYQQDKAMTLIGSGGWSGYGKDRAARLIRMNKLPEEHNDMIFVVVVNRWGLLGGGAVLTLYAVLVGAMLAVSAATKNPFARLSIVGFASLIFFQVAINVGVAAGLLPVTGITLPFVSYGGSSLVAMFTMLGLTVNFAAQPPAIVMRPSFEFDNPEAALQ